MDKEKLKYIISEMNMRKNMSFSGIGLIVYKSLFSLSIEPIGQYRNQISLPIRSKSEIINTLLSISNENNEMHDGFHFLNSYIDLTHVSYYVSTLIDENIKPKLHKGSRYRTAFYSSLAENIACTVIIGKNYDPIIFDNGLEFNLNDF